MNIGDGTRAGRVLVVDDEAPNRELLRVMLERVGYDVLLAETGTQALKIVEGEEPDVILLDVLMPELDGIEVCRRLKEREETAAIPVLLVTGLSDRESRLRGIEAGADDYLSKPIDKEDVRLRVRNAVASKRLVDRVREHLLRLQELEGLRDNLTHMIVHDLRSPMITITGFLELLLRRAGDRLDERERGYIRKAMRGTDRMLGLVNSLLDVSRLEAQEMPLNLEAADLVLMGRKALDDLGPPPETQRYRFEASDDVVTVLCDRDVIARVLNNLLGNALRYSPVDGEIRLHVRSEGRGGRFEVSDQGPGIPAIQRERIFDKFAQVEAGKGGRGPSSGLGLTFCKLAVESQGGEIGVEDALEGGALFWVRLPGPSRD